MYNIVRMYIRDIPSRIIKKGVSLEEAQEHCKNPESSSRTCKRWKNKRRTEIRGAWFDGYQECKQ